MSITDIVSLKILAKKIGQADRFVASTTLLFMYVFFAFISRESFCVFTTESHTTPLYYTQSTLHSAECKGGYKLLSYLLMFVYTVHDRIRVNAIWIKAEHVLLLFY